MGSLKGTASQSHLILTFQCLVLPPVTWAVVFCNTLQRAFSLMLGWYKQQPAHLPNIPKCLRVFQFRTSIHTANLSLCEGKPSQHTCSILTDVYNNILTKETALLSDYPFLFSNFYNMYVISATLLTKLENWNCDCTKYAATSAAGLCSSTLKLLNSVQYFVHFIGCSVSIVLAEGEF